jgi:hypothetical protein
MWGAMMVRHLSYGTHFSFSVSANAVQQAGEFGIGLLRRRTPSLLPTSQLLLFRSSFRPLVILDRL